MRLYVDILKHKDTDCTNQGLSSFNDEAILIIEGDIEKIKNDKPNHPCVFVLEQGYGRRQYMAIPFDQWLQAKNLRRSQTGKFGGNFLYTSDSRFHSDQPIHIHDRYEN